MTATGWGRAPVAQTILAVKEDGWQTMLMDSFLREWSNVQASTADLKQLSGLALLRQLLPNEFARQALELAPPLPEAEAEPGKHRISPECLSKLEGHVERMVSNAFALLEKKMLEAEPGEVRALYDHIDATSMAEVCSLYTEFQLRVPAPLVARLSPETRWLGVWAMLLNAFPDQFLQQRPATAADRRLGTGLLHSRRAFHGPVVTLLVYLEEYAEDSGRLSVRHELQIALDDPEGISRMWAMVMRTGPKQSKVRQRYDVCPLGPFRAFMYRDGPLSPAAGDVEAMNYRFIFREMMSPEGEARAAVYKEERAAARRARQAEREAAQEAARVAEAALEVEGPTALSPDPDVVVESSIRLKVTGFDGLIDIQVDLRAAHGRSRMWNAVLARGPSADRLKYRVYVPGRRIDPTVPGDRDDVYSNGSIADALGFLQGWTTVTFMYRDQAGSDGGAEQEVESGQSAKRLRGEECGGGGQAETSAARAARAANARGMMVATKDGPNK